MPPTNKSLQFIMFKLFPNKLLNLSTRRSRDINRLQHILLSSEPLDRREAIHLKRRLTHQFALQTHTQKSTYICASILATTTSYSISFAISSYTSPLSPTSFHVLQQVLALRAPARIEQHNHVIMPVHDIIEAPRVHIHLFSTRFLAPTSVRVVTIGSN